MLEYNEFIKFVEKEFTNYLPEKYRQMKLETRKITQTNRMLDGIVLIGDHGVPSPTLSINYMYKYYCESGDLKKSLEYAAKVMDDSFSDMPIITFDFLDSGMVKKNVIFQLVNTFQNKELLQSVPHRTFLNMSIIYRLVVDHRSNGALSTILTYDHINAYGMKEEDLFGYASRNTREILPPAFYPLDPFVPMIILTNNKQLYGATILLYDEELQEIAQIFGENFYILPSSIHECIAVPAFAVTDPLECAKMVHSINMEELKITERLSNQVYYYDRAKRQLSIATNIDECLV